MDFVVVVFMALFLGQFFCASGHVLNVGSPSDEVSDVGEPIRLLIYEKCPIKQR